MEPLSPAAWSIQRGRQALERSPSRRRRQPLQAPRVRVPVGRDLRRYALGVGLRASRRRAEGEHQAAVVALHGDHPRRRRGHRLVGDPAAAGVGGLGSHQGVRRPAGGVPVVPPPVPGRPHRGGVRRAQGPHGAARRDPLPELRQPRLDRAEAVQRPAQDLPRPRRGRVGPALPSARDRAGHLRELPQRHDELAQEAPVRHRPDRQVVPQRDHPGQLHLPHARVRADGDGVLRRARHRRGMAPVLDRRAHPLVRRPRRPRTTCGTTSTRRRSCRTTRSAPSTSSTGSASRGRSGASSRASPTAPTST